MAFFFGVFHVTGAESTSPVFLGGFHAVFGGLRLTFCLC